MAQDITVTLTVPADQVQALMDALVNRLGLDASDAGSESSPATAFASSLESSPAASPEVSSDASVAEVASTRGELITDRGGRVIGTTAEAAAGDDAAAAE